MRKRYLSALGFLGLAMHAAAQTPAPISGPQSSKRSEAASPLNSTTAAPTIFAEPAPSNCLAEACSDRPRAYLQADAIYLWRTRGDDIPLAVNGVTGDQVLGTRDLRTDIQAGPQVYLGIPVGANSHVELGYFGIYDWRGSGAALDPNANLFVPLNDPNNTFIFDNAVQATTSSKLNNVELNLRRSVGTMVSILGGLRYVELNDRFTMLTTQPNFLVPGSAFGLYDIRANSRLMGPQVGGNFSLPIGTWLTLGMGTKLGLFASDQSQSQAIVDDITGAYGAPVTLRNSSDNTVRAAFIAEMNFLATFRLTSNLYARAGYKLLWLDGVAVGTEQIDYTTSNLGGRAVRAGDVFYNGFVTGLEWRWGG